MNIFLFNQYAGNKGDRAVLYALCRLILEISPNSSITVSTSSPELYDDYSFYKENCIRFVPYAWDYGRIKEHKVYWRFLNKIHKYTFSILREAYLSNVCKWIARFISNPRFYKEAKSANVVLSVGGHHYCTLLSKDLVSSINFDAMVLKCMGKQIICFSQTFGPFDFYNFRNKIVTKKILSDSYLYVREEESVRTLLDFKIPDNNIYRTYETVLSLNRIYDSYRKPSDRLNRIGISIYSTQKRPEDEEEMYISSIAQFCNYSIGMGYEIVFFPMEIKGTIPDDRPFISRIIKKVCNKRKCKMIDKDMHTHEHLDEVSKCQIYIGHKTHSTIFALATGTPLIAIAYHSKTIEFMKQYGLEEYAIADKDLTGLLLIERFEQLVQNIDIIGTKEFNKSREIAISIKETLSEILQK